MITKKTTGGIGRWTEPKETLELYREFQGKYSEDLMPPKCKVCNAVTCYMVEKREEAVEKMLPFLAASSMLSLQTKGDWIYCTVTVCNKCGAREAAKLDFQQRIYTPNFNDYCLTESEWTEWLKIYRVTQNKLSHERRDQQTELDNKKNRYNIKKEKSATITKSVVVAPEPPEFDYNEEPVTDD